MLKGKWNMRLIITAGLLALPVSAFAVNTEPSGFYAGVGASQIDYSGKVLDAVGGKPEWTAIEFAGGYKHNPYVGVEARLGASTSPDLLYSGLYYRTESANETAKTYLLLGFAGANVKATSGKDLSLSGPSYGAGVGFPVGKHFNFNLEYRQLLDDSSADVRLNALTASLDYRFAASGMSAKSGRSESTHSEPYDQQGFYVGLGIAKITLSVDAPVDEGDLNDYDDEDYSEPDFKWNAVELIGGYSHSPLATVEVRLGTTDNAGEEGVDLTLDYASIYYRPSVRFNKVELYGLLGYSSVRSNFEAEGYYDDEYEEYVDGEKDSERFSGISVGAGVRADITDKLSAGIEYRLLARDELEADEDVDSETWDFTALSANLTYRF
jgi:opacity protein-like surface antigen